MLPGKCWALENDEPRRERAREQAVVRAHGAVPATVAILDGVARVGLTADELRRVAESGREGHAVKCSRRFLPRK